MTSFDPTNDPAKIYLVGETGSGKTGAKASLVCAGYKLRMIDTDKGFKTLRSLLTDPHYPYADYMRRHNIDPSKNVSVIPVDTPMELRMTERIQGSKTTREKLLAPKHGRAWEQITDILSKWVDQDGTNYGHVETWGPDCILDLDTWSTISMQSFYFIQSLNGRLGAREDGHDYQRDIGGAQAQLRRLLEWLSNDAVKCNVIINSHITTIDSSRGINMSPEQRQRLDPEALLDIHGYPESIGRALSKKMGKYINDEYTVRRRGTGQSTHHVISTVPVDIDGASISVKHSAWLEPEYDVRDGLARIFAAIKGQPDPKELVAELAKPPSVSAAPLTQTVSSGRPSALAEAGVSVNVK